MDFPLPAFLTKKLIRFLPLLLCVTSNVWGQELLKSEVQLVIKNPPQDLPAGRTTVAISRLLGHVTTTAATCEGGAEHGRHLRPREQSAGIQIDSPMLSSKGPYDLPDPAGCGYGKTNASLHRGTGADDTFIVDEENDRVDGLAGNDRIDGGRGDDVLIGGPGNDILVGGDGKDSLDGGEGNDSLFGGLGNDRADGGPGDDVQEGGAGDDVLDGGPDNDTLFGDEGADLLLGGTGNDVLEGNAGDDTLVGGEGKDELDGGIGDDRLMGGDGDDSLKGEAGRDLIDGGLGNDRLEGQDGSDFLDGGPGNDILEGGDDPDILIGGAGDDVLRGDDANDTLDGGAGADKLYGNDGNDNLEAGAGDDLLDGGDGDDKLFGGPGADRAVGGEGKDIIDGGPGADFLAGDIGDDVLDGGAEDDQLLGGDGRDVLRGSTGGDRLDGGRGSDFIDAGEGDDTILLASGDSDVTSEEIIDGGPGEDTLVLNGFVPARISGSPAASGTFVITDPLTGGVYRVSNVEHIRYTQWVSYLGAGGQLSSTLILANSSSSREATAKIDFLSPDGKPLELSIAGAAAKSTLELKLPPLGSREISVAASGQAITGRARIESDQPLAAAVRFSSPNLGTGILPQSLLSDSFAMPVIRDRPRGISTGIFVVNGATGGFYELALAHPSGAQYDSTDLTTAPGSQLVRDIEALFPEMEDFQGVFQVSGTSLAAFSVLRRGNELTVLPALRFGGVREDLNNAQRAELAGKPAIPGRTLYFPRLGGGPQSGSELFLLNTSSVQRAKGTLDFFGNDGSPLAVPIEDREPANTLSFDLAPAASNRYRFAALPSRQEGSVRVRMTEGASEAVLIYAVGTGSVGLEPGIISKGFIAPVRSRPGVTTRIMAASTGAAAQLQFTLRNAQGQTVPGANTNVALPANGSLSRSLEELFPNAPVNDFQGAVTASGGPDALVAAAVVEQEGARIAALPVTPLQ